MKRVALGVVLACVSTACAASREGLPWPRSSSPGEATIVGAEPNAAAAEATVAVTAAPARPETWVHAATASDFVLVDGEAQFVGVWVDVPGARPRAHVPTSVTLTIDTSGSMTGDKIVRAREAARVLVAELADGDRVAVHAFADSAHELIAPTVLDARSRQAIVGTIAELRADGATNLYDALGLALGRARVTPASHPVRRVVVISDGRATAGPSSPAALGQLAEQGAAQGVQVTALGVGLDYDEEALNALAVRSNGRLYHLSDARELAGIVRSELRLLQSTMAVGAYVEVVPAPGVVLLGTPGVESQRTASGALRVALGTLHAGQRREILVSVRVSGTPGEGHHPIASARLHYADPNDDGVQRVQEVVARASLTTDGTRVAAHANVEVQGIVVVQQAAQAATEARLEVASGRFEVADQDLARAEALLRVQAQQVPTARDRQRITAAADGLARSRRSVQATATAPAAARPSAARAASLELNDTAMEAMGF